MPANRFDVIVVGARCAGAALAQRLARAGASVALLDGAQPGSGQRTSTHLIQPPGMDELDALQVGPRVRQQTPPLRAMRLAFDQSETRLKYGPGREAHCLRRERLDPLLQEAAVSAGTQLRLRTTVTDTLRGPNGRVRGVEVRPKSRNNEHLYADLVVGADGRNSTIAKLVGAREYLAYDGPRACYWAYWRRPPQWNPNELCNFYRRNDAFVVFPTDQDQLLIATAPPLEGARLWRSDHTAAYLDSVASYDPISSHFDRAETPLSEVRGVVKTRYYFRASAGPGWALIGDAGHHKEFFLGLGISDALRDAHDLSIAILEDEPAAIQAWWRTRDLKRIELYHWGRDIGRADSVNPLERLSAQRMASAPHLQGRLGEIIDGHRSPFDLVPPTHAARWVATSLIRGDAGPMRPLVAALGERVTARRELRRRQRALHRAQPARHDPVGRQPYASSATSPLS